MKGDDEGAEAELNYDETLGLGDFVAGERDDAATGPRYRVQDRLELVGVTGGIQRIAT